MTRSRIFQAIEIERARADMKHGEMSVGGKGITDAQRAVVLGEEFGEVCRALLDGDRANLKTELVQLAGCAVAFLETLGGDL